MSIRKKSRNLFNKLCVYTTTTTTAYTATIKTTTTVNNNNNDNEIQTPPGFWDANGLPILTQTTRPSNNQQQK